MSKLAIAAETEADRYDVTTQVRCLDCRLDQLSVAEEGPSQEQLKRVVDGIMNANTFSRKEEVKAWEQELTSCEHILLLQQDPPRKVEGQDLVHCSMCELSENLWLCLQCGNLGCGRHQKGGAPGNSHALAHSGASHHGVAVKLGSITPEGNADVYCYTCDEERIDENLGAHLANWGILLSERTKTEKSLTEMQVEHNLKYEFTMTSEDGKELKPLFGPGLTGLKNLGNSCYLASIVQCLFDLPQFRERYFGDGNAAENLATTAREPAADLEVQLRKLADGLLSGRYSEPDDSVSAPVSVDGSAQPTSRFQKGLSPSMFKHLVGRDHAEFSTMRQQDAFELLQHLLELITKSKHPRPDQDPTRQFRFVQEERLQCLSCKRVRYSSTVQDSVIVGVPLTPLPPDEEGGPTKYAPVQLSELLDAFTAEEKVKLKCAACGSTDAGFTKRSLFKTLPETLVLNASKMAVINGAALKVDVPVLVPDDDTPIDLSAYVSRGHQPDEELLPDDQPVSTAPAWTPNPDALAMLEGMGFPRVRAERALHATGNADAEAAMTWLLEHLEDPDIDKPLDFGGAKKPASAAVADPGKIKLLGAMGFTAPQARKALRETSGDVERAIDWLFTHPDDMGELEEETPGSAELPARYELRSIVCHKGTSIHAG